MTKVEILTDLQKKVLEKLFSDEWFRRHFYLTGGTALSAFYLYHRYSDDLDFFCHNVDLLSIPNLVKTMAKEMGAPAKQTKKSPGFIRYMINDALQLDFVQDIQHREGVPELIGNFMVDNIKNIAVNKICAILGRLDTKDYVDLYFLLNEKKYDVMELLSLAQRKDAGLEPFVWASVIGDVNRLPFLPKMVRKITLDEMKRFFEKLRDEILDRIKPDNLNYP